MRTGTINNYVKFSKSFGGVRKCYEGKPIIAVGGFKCDTSLMPTDGAAMAAGTMVFADETKEGRTIVPLYTFRVKSVDAGKKQIVVEKFETGSIAKVGMKLMVVGDDLTKAATKVATISEVDKSASDYDTLTVDDVTGVEENAVLAEAGADSKIKVIPNGLTYCDNVLDSDAYAIDIDYIWNCMEKPVLERRMPPITASLKKALRDNECYFRFSPRS